MPKGGEIRNFYPGDKSDEGAPAEALAGGYPAKVWLALPRTLDSKVVVSLSLGSCPV
jgi:hypothetical protein